MLDCFNYFNNISTSFWLIIDDLSNHFNKCFYHISTLCVDAKCAHTTCANKIYKPIMKHHVSIKDLWRFWNLKIFMYYPIIVHMACCGGLLNVMFCAKCTMCMYIIEYNNLKLKQCEHTTCHQIISCVYLKELEHYSWFFHM
jgi:hypothetical protein